jgi:hypothetical protein
VVTARGVAAVALAASLALPPSLSGCAVIGRRRGGGGGAADARIVLYRDRAIVDEEVVADVRGGRAALPLPAGVAADQLSVASPDVHVVAWAATAAGGQRDVTATGGARAQRGRLVGLAEDGVALVDGDRVHVVGGAELLAGAVRPAIVAEVEGPAGRARFRLRYPTDRLRWHASYALVEHRGHARLRGALAIDNQTGRRWRRAALAVIDAPAPTADAAGASPATPARLPGRYPIDVGAQRVELALGEQPIALRRAMVYDPVGSGLQHEGQPPEQDPGYGVQRWPATLDETVKLDLAAVADVQLPAGPVRLAIAEPDGALRWRGEGELLPPAAGAERYLTIAVGRVSDVTGTRRRTDFVIDQLRQRLIEELTITLTSTRAAPVDVLVREHVYRGPCWWLAYHSTGDRVAKEGAQQIALTTTVPAHGTATVAYRVIYHWSDAECSPPSPSSN